MSGNQGDKDGGLDLLLAAAGVAATQCPVDAMAAYIASKTAEKDLGPNSLENTDLDFDDVVDVKPTSSIKKLRLDHLDPIEVEFQVEVNRAIDDFLSIPPTNKSVRDFKNNVDRIATMYRIKKQKQG